MTEKRAPSVTDVLREVGLSANKPTIEKDQAALLEESEERQKRIQRQEESAAIDRQMAYAKLRAFQEHHDNKGRWSIFVMWAMGLMIGYQSLLLGLVGGGVWDFSEYEWLLPSLLVQNLAQVITLAAIIVKALFDKHKE